MLSVRRDVFVHLLIVIVMCQPAIGEVITIADTNTTIPFSTESFTQFASKVSLDRGDVGFIGHGVERQGVYTSIDGVLNAVADTSIIIPEGSGGNFTAFSSIDGLSSSVSMKDGHVAFLGEGTGLIDLGIFTNLGGTLVNVANASDRVPSKSETFIGFSNPAIGADNVAFFGVGFGGSDGVYKGQGAGLDVVADNQTPVPEGDFNFLTFRFNGFARDGEDLAFGGRGGRHGDGIYKHVSGAVSVVSNKGNHIPEGTGTFTDFGFDSFRERMSLSAGHVAFIGFGTEQTGVYTDLTGSLTKVADTDDVIPKGMGEFTDFLDVAIDGETIAFLGIGTGGQKGIYAWHHGIIEKVVDLNDGDWLSPGKKLLNLDLHSEGLSNKQIALWAKFEDGFEGIYVADIVIPEPSTLTVLSCASAALFRRSAIPLQ